MKLATGTVIAGSLLAMACTSGSKAPDDAAAMAAKPAGGGAASASVFPYAVQRATLDNGLSVVMIPMPSEGLVAYWSIVRTGSRDEVEQGVTGFAHFFEHMMFRGTETLPGPEYDRIVNGMGADANAFTTDDFTAYHLGFARADLAKVVEIEADRFQNLSYDEAEFKTESGAVYGEYRKGRTSPFEVLFESLQDTAFEKHTYKHTTIGFEADIADMPNQFAYSKGFFRRFYRPENVVVVVAGDFDPAETLALVRKNYGGWKRGYTAPDVPVEPEQEAQKRVDVAFDGETLPLVTVAFKGPRFDPSDRTVVAGTLVGDLVFGETSPLYKKLVLDEQRVDRLMADFGYNRDPGLWVVIAAVKDPADVAAVEAEIWAAVDALVEHGVGAQRLDDVRSHQKYAFLSSLTTPSAVCGQLARLVALTGDVAAVDRLYDTLDRVTPEDVRAAAKKVLRPEHSTIALLHAKDHPLPEQRASSANATAFLLNTRAPAAGASSSARGAAGTPPSTAARLPEAPVLLPVAQDPNVSFKIWFRVGSQDDPPGQEGLAALTGALVGEGATKTRSYDEILAALYPLAAGYSVSVDREMTVVEGSVHRDVVGAFHPLLADALLRPAFDPADFERVRDQFVTGIEKRLRYSSDEELGKAALVQAVFQGTPYAHLDEGTVESLKRLTAEDVRAFWAAHYTRDDVVLGLGGAYPAELPGALSSELATLPAGSPERTPPPQPRPIQGRHVRIVEKPGPNTAISFGYPIDLVRGSREFYALWIANSWLGEHRNSSSHLYQVIREARGMNYGDYSYIEAFPNGGRRSMPPTGVGRRSQMFEVWIRPVPEERAVFALRAALRELDRLSREGLTREQFEFTRRFLENYVLHFAETTEERLGYAIDDRFYGIGAPGHLAKMREMMGALTLQDVNAAVKKHLQSADLEIAMVTAHAAELKAALVSDAPSPIDYGSVPKPKEILDEDALIERWPLAIRAENVEIVPVDRMFQSSATRP